MAMKLISTNTITTGGITNIAFSAIPQNYTDLYLFLNLRSDVAAWGTGSSLKFNNDSGANYTWRGIYAFGSSGVGPNVSTGTTSIQTGVFPGSSSNANTFSAQTLYIPNYTSSTHKSVSIDSVNEGVNSTSVEMDMNVGIWASTSAITNLQIGSNSGNFVIGSTISLYGIIKGNGGATVA